MTCTPQNPVVIAVTGGIACGKSEVGRFLGKMGFAVCDADQVAHELMKKGTPVYQRVVEFFGTRILSDNGEISRPRLGQEVFEHSEKRDVLNQLVHPAVQAVVEERIKEARLGRRSMAVLVPLLFESGMDSLKWDSVVCVSSPRPQVVQRLELRGLGKQETEQRIDSQIPQKEKEQRSDHLIRNNGSLEELEQSTRETAQRIMTKGVL